MRETTRIEVDEYAAMIADKDLDGEELLDWFLNATKFHFKYKHATLRELVVHAVKGMIAADTRHAINKLEEIMTGRGPSKPPTLYPSERLPIPPDKPSTLLDVFPDTMLTTCEREAFREGWKDRRRGVKDPGVRGKYVDPALARIYSAGWHEANRRGTPFPYSGTTCSVCNRRQYVCTGGLTCDEGHGGADPVEEDYHVCLNCEIPLGWKPSLKQPCPRCGTYPKEE
jgi:hypothetical protein